ncbi:MAG: hypothetical protein KAJ42_01650 [Gemmatimonadetes bacterium]|nr:hypothetical protein [Gemmatimonadota bacterium]
MAFGLNRWISYVALCLIIAAAWALPPRRYGRNYYPSERTPEREQAVRLREEIGRLDRHYQRLLRRDSLVSMVRTAREEGRSCIFGASGEYPTDSLHVLEEAFAREVDRVVGGTPKVTAGLYLFRPREWTHEGLKEDGRGIPTYYSAYEEFYAGSMDGISYCLLAFPVRGRFSSAYRNLQPALPEVEAMAGANNMLGPCVFHLRYGHPSEAVFQWLRDGGYRLAQEQVSYEARRQLEYYRDLYDVNRVFGIRIGYRFSIDAEACLAGDADACERSIVDIANPRSDGREFYAARFGIPVSQVDMPVSYYDYRYFWGLYGGFDRALLADIETEFGPERFQRFWTSEEEFAEAFESAFGVPLGDWVMKWAQERLGKIETTPTLPLQASALSLLIMGLFAALVGVVAQRRVVGK